MWSSDALSFRAHRDQCVIGLASMSDPFLISGLFLVPAIRLPTGNSYAPVGNMCTTGKFQPKMGLSHFSRSVRANRTEEIMQVPNGRNTSLRRAAILGSLICLLIALSVLSGCGGSSSTSGGTNPPPPTHFLLVSDSGTNRVVVYSSPFSNGDECRHGVGPS